MSEPTNEKRGRGDGRRIRALLRENEALKKRKAELEAQVAGSVETFAMLRREPDSILDEGD